MRSNKMPCVTRVDQFLVCSSSVETALNFSWKIKKIFIPEVLNLLRPSREFCGRIYRREDFLHVLSLESFLTASFSKENFL